MTRVTRPVMRWHGGKWRLAGRILPYFPTHRIYEPHEQFPNITKACIEICEANNGGRQGVRDEIDRFLTDRYGDLDALAPIDAWLGELTDEDLSTITDGAEDEADLILLAAPDGTKDLIEAYFNDVC